MIVTIDNKKYKVLVEDTYIKDSVTFVENVPLSEWVEFVSKKGVSSLYEFEEVLSYLLNKQVSLKNDYPELRKQILNLSGSIKRLPDNLIFELVE